MRRIYVHTHNVTVVCIGEPGGAASILAASRSGGVLSIMPQRASIQIRNESEFSVMSMFTAVFHAVNEERVINPILKIII